MCGAILMALYGVVLGLVAFHTIAWLVPRLARVFPVLLGGVMTASMFYALGYLALHS